MTDAEWLAATDLRRFWGDDLPCMSDRKWSLLLSACLPLLTHRDPCATCREEARTVFEQIADSEWLKVHEILGEAGRRTHPPGSSGRCTVVKCFYYMRQYWRGNMLWLECWNHILGEISYSNFVYLNELSQSLQEQTESSEKAVVETINSYRSAMAAEWAAGADLLREVAGNPFRNTVISPTLLTWDDGLLVSMARCMYDTRDFHAMPILADALEEAGCTDADILNHCRQPGEHVRGCWVVDLLLGKS